jgi:hypothetical protein
MEPEGSLSCSQEPATGHYPKTDESNPHIQAYFRDEAPNLGPRCDNVLLGQGYHTPRGAVVDENGTKIE